MTGSRALDGRVRLDPPTQVPQRTSALMVNTGPTFDAQALPLMHSWGPGRVFVAGIPTPRRERPASRAHRPARCRRPVGRGTAAVLSPARTHTAGSSVPWVA